jgi:hypothetical protein
LVPPPVLDHGFVPPLIPQVPACSAILLAVPANLLIPPAMQNVGVHTDEGMQQGSSHVVLYSMLLLRKWYYC